MGIKRLSTSSTRNSPSAVRLSLHGQSAPGGPSLPLPAWTGNACRGTALGSAGGWPARSRAGVDGAGPGATVACPRRARSPLLDHHSPDLDAPTLTARRDAFLSAALTQRNA
jgi:hypothetical protein